MEKQREQWKKVLDKTEVVAIVTSSDEGAHTVGTWGDYVRTLGVEREEVRIPVWGYHKTGENIRKGSLVELLMGSKSLQRPSGKFGQGCKLSRNPNFRQSGGADKKNISRIKRSFDCNCGKSTLHIQRLNLITPLPFYISLSFINEQWEIT